MSDHDQVKMANMDYSKDRPKAKNPVKIEDLWRELDDLAARHDVHWRWVKAHAGNEGNERADALANLGLDEGFRDTGT